MGEWNHGSISPILTPTKDIASLLTPSSPLSTPLLSLPLPPSLSPQPMWRRSEGSGGKKEEGEEKRVEERWKCGWI